MPLDLDGLYEEGYADGKREAAEWQDFSGATPLDKPVLLWFIGRNAHPAAHGCAIGSISSHQPGSVWTDGDYRPVEWFSHWQPLPAGPKRT